MPTIAKTIPPLSEKEQARFKSNVIIGNATSDCHEWKLGKTARGYGVFWLDGRQVRSSRAAYTIAFGAIPNGLFVCHKCDNPGCINPLYLFLGTTNENMSDMVKKGRQTQGDSHYSRTHPEKLARGDRHVGARKITPGQVIEIRGLKGITQTAIAKIYGVKPVTINAIINRKNWKHI